MKSSRSEIYILFKPQYLYDNLHQNRKNESHFRGAKLGQNQLSFTIDIFLASDITLYYLMQS